MKKTLILFFLFILLSSCSVVKYNTKTTFIDFSEYIEKGFYISVGNDEPYEADNLGYIEVNITSGADKNIKHTGSSSGLIGDKSGAYHEATVNDAIELLYQKAIEVGADGILNLKFYYTNWVDGKIMQTFASGIAIKKRN